MGSRPEGSERDVVTAGEVDARSVSLSAGRGCSPFGAACPLHQSRLLHLPDTARPSDASACVPAPQNPPCPLSNEAPLVVSPGVTSSNAFHSCFSSSQTRKPPGAMCSREVTS